MYSTPEKIVNLFLMGLLLAIEERKKKKRHVTLDVQGKFSFGFANGSLAIQIQCILPWMNVEQP